MSKARDILIVPTYSRPEMLAVCMERISLCPEAAELEIRVCVDNHLGVATIPPLKEIGEVLQRYPTLEVRAIVREAHQFAGNTYNLMRAYLEAYDSEARFVFMVEDDVLVAPDFFAWHYAAQKTGDWFCSVASTCRKQGALQEEYIIAKGYTSIGVCFERQKLKPIIEHASPAYFGNLTGYMRKAFPSTGVPDQYTEQDGLITRILLDSNQYSIWPRRARCQHVGWYGYHRWRGSKPAGSLDERIEQVKKTICDPAALKRVVRDYSDIEPLAV